MKAKLLRVLLLAAIVFTMNSCSSSDSENQDVKASELKVVNYDYNASELQTLELINSYRVSVGLKALAKINHISYKSEEHDNYMITNKKVSHDGFVERSENIMNVLGAKKVGENIAYNFKTPQGAVDAWLNSPGHKENIVGDFTHVGISIREDAATGRKYYTNIFAKI
jgi:uncharacterized protein YkwD